MEIKEIEAKIGIYLDNNNNPNEILFFSGAGISSADPCGFPVGDELHKILLRSFTRLSETNVKEIIKNIPFEKTVSIIVQANGKMVNKNIALNLLTELFIYRQSDQFKHENDYHKFFRNHINLGGKHFTVNLDQFIELDHTGRIEPLTLMEFNSEDEIQTGFLFKIHGDPIFNPYGWQGFLIEVIKDGFKTNFETFLSTTFNSVKIVIFIGYGGVDCFDVTNYFINLPDKCFNSTNAVWIEYSKDHSEPEISNDYSKKQSPILTKFRESMVIKCKFPELILNKLFDNRIQSITNTQRMGSYLPEYGLLFGKNAQFQPDLVKTKIGNDLLNLMN